MKKNSIVFTLTLAMLFFILSSDIDGPAHHGHGDVTGAPTGTLGHCQTTSCHGGNNPLNVVLLQVIDTATTYPVTTYYAGRTYMVQVTGDATAIATSLPGFGFQVSAVFGNHTLAGSYTIPSALASDIHTYSCGATTVVEHSTRLAPVTAGVNKYSIYFYWTAPAPHTDSVTFFAMLNAVNGDGTDAGDNPDAAPNVTLYENFADTVTTYVGTINATGSSFNVYPNPSSCDPAVSYNIVSLGLVSIAVYDINGRKIAQLADNELQGAGEHIYHPAIAAPGVYFIKMQTGSLSNSAKFVKQ